MNTPLTTFSRYAKSSYSLLFLMMIISLVAGLGYAAPLGEDDPKAIITPKAGEYSHSAPPTFDIQTGTNRYYKVQLALAKSLLSSPADRIASDGTEEKRNFYDSGWLECSNDVVAVSAIVSEPQGCTNGVGTYTVDPTAWSKMHGSVVFYRILTSTIQDENNALKSEVTNETKINRTGETWYGLPFNKQATIGSINVLIDRQVGGSTRTVLNGRAVSSDYGPRNVTDGSRFHGGLDIPVAKGTPIYAVAYGTVVSVPSATDQMHRLDINHGSYRTGYVHLDKAVVDVNETVFAGQLIGYSGDWFNGLPDNVADHLHFDSGYTSSQIFHNPLDYVLYTDDHTLTTGETTFLGDAYTHKNPIDVAEASGDQTYVLIAFGVTTDYDKDLNYVKVQVDNSTVDGQFFELDYDQVESQDSGTGVVTLNNGRTFRVRPLSDDIYGDDNLAYDFYVKPADTNVDLVAKDYFFFRWDIQPYENVKDGGPHTINVNLREVEEGSGPTRSLTIGPEIRVAENSPTINGNKLEYTLIVVNHDYEGGNIPLMIEGLPMDWDVTFSNANPFIVSDLNTDGSVEVKLELLTDGPASITPICENNTRIVAKFARIPVFMDTVELCPKVWIDKPAAGTEFTEGDNVPITVKIRSGLVASSVGLSIDGAAPVGTSPSNDGTWSYQWTAPAISEYAKEFNLQAVATINGESVPSDAVMVIVNKKMETKIVTILSPVDGQEVKPGEGINIEVFADLGVTDVQLTIDGQTQPLTKVGDTKYTTTWTVPSSAANGKEYELKASGKYNGQSLLPSVKKIKVVIPQYGSVTFKNPTHNSTVMVGDQITVKVYTPMGVQNVYLSISPNDGGAGGWMSKTGEVEGETEIWQWSAWAPTNIGTQYTLQATAHMPDSTQIHSDPILVNVTPAQATIEVQEPIKLGDEVTVTVKAKDAFSVYLTANGLKIAELSHTNTEWKFSWKPTIAGNVRLRATVHYNNGDFQYPERMVEVIDESQNMIIVEIVEPKQGDTMYVGDRTAIMVTSPGLIKKIEIEITDGENNVEKKSETSESGDYSIGLFWTSPQEGVYRIKAYAWSMEGYPGWTDAIEVTAVTKPIDPKPTPEDTGIWTPINEYAYLWRTRENIDWDYLGTDAVYDTEIPSSEYICGIVGFGSKGGDIGENHFDTYTAVHIVMAYLETWTNDEDKSWHIRAEFDTLNKKNPILSDSLTEDPERWFRFDVLCIDRDFSSIASSQLGKNILIHQWRTSLGDQVGLITDKSTSISSEEYVCGIVGFDSGHGDIQEFDDGDIIQTYLFSKNGEWHIRADFRSHNGANENWAVNLLCIHRDIASIGTPQAGKPFVLKEYTDLGDNISYPTEFDVKDWACGVVGFAARDGDIDEHDQSDGTNLILAYMFEGSEKWHIRADFRTHNDDESWDVNVLCMHKKLSEAPEMLGAEPYLFTTRDSNNVLYGPGMQLKWTETYHPNAKYYEIQFSEDGGTTWQLLDNQRSITHGGWRNHHGNMQCGFGFGRCLKRNQVYSYRVRVLDGTQNPITDWSNVISATSMEWPAHVQLANPVPEGPYNSPHTVTLSLVNTYGYIMTLNWQITPWSGASYTILSGCQKGSYSCKIEIRDASGGVASNTESVSKLSSLAPISSVVVQVTGTSIIDGNNYTSFDEVTLHFKDGCVGDDCVEQEIFSDVPSEHWASGYIEYLYQNGYTSGCSTGENLEFCADEQMTRGEVSVFLVRTYHPEEPGYTPEEPELVTFEDLYANPSWVDKWAMELFNRGVTSGCSSNPLLFCSDDITTRSQMAVFAVRTLLGEGYLPDQPKSQLFNDVPLYDANGNLTWASKWIHEAYHQGLIQACQTDMVGMNYRPEDPITRGEAACILYYALTNIPAIE